MSVIYSQTFCYRAAELSIAYLLDPGEYFNVEMFCPAVIKGISSRGGSKSKQLSKISCVA